MTCQCRGVALLGQARGTDMCLTATGYQQEVLCEACGTTGCISLLLVLGGCNGVATATVMARRTVRLSALVPLCTVRGANWPPLPEAFTLTASSRLTGRSKYE